MRGFRGASLRNLEARIGSAMKIQNLVLIEEQHSLYRLFERAPGKIAVTVGSTGTAKTFSERLLTLFFIESGQKVLIVAPQNSIADHMADTLYRS